MTREALRQGDGIGGWRIAGWGMGALILLLPLAAMAVTDEVRWTAGDFAFAAAMLGGVGGAMELAVRSRHGAAFRLGTAAMLAAASLILWVNAAVGIIGDEHDDWNLLYPALLACVLGLAALGRFRPRALAHAALLGAAGSVALGILAVALIGDGPDPVLTVAAAHMVFAALFGGATILFRRAA